MGTPCIVNFAIGEVVTSSIYVHWDGYPDHMIPLFQKFFKEVERQTKDTRFNDPSYLASKFVVFYSGECQYKDAPLDFLGIGIVYPGVTESYNYLIDCGNRNEDGRPKVNQT